MNQGEKLKKFVKSWSNCHSQARRPNLFLFATPRGGSTWFMEMIWSQKGMKYCSEPFNVRRPEVALDLGIKSFPGLYAEGSHEKYASYLQKICRNKIRYNNPNPFRKHSNFFTDRIVFKVIHAGMDRIPWFEERFQAKAFVVIRHPIPVSLSRKVFPLLDQFEESDYSRHFSKEQLDVVAKVKAGGDHLSRGVVAWCLHNYFPLSRERGKHMVLSYEEALLKPEAMIDYMARELELEDKQRMLDQSAKPSAVLSLSSIERKKLLSEQSGNRTKLINSWRNQIDEAREKELMQYLEIFNIDAYQVGVDAPSAKYLQFD